MNDFFFGEFFDFNIFCWGLIIFGITRLLIVGFEKINRRKIPQALKAAIQIPIVLSIALLCAAKFPLPI
ncbi:hypothetical protein [Pseudomonas sp. Xaverov 259]|uniref:hypothetical protein n=1 Tax=Pseudomonas sp. Xaverov 259 TaxID=2666086 RepID=UPI001C5B7874|nr:hypothetical protein [Pseudomonas sp. Xaverov 259]